MFKATLDIFGSEQWIGRAKYQIAVFAGFLVLAIGAVDYATGTEVNFSIVYCFPILIAAWYCGVMEGAFIALLCIVVWFAGDIVSPSHQNYSVPLWNLLIRTVFYGLLVALITRLNFLQRFLEVKVEERAAALNRESLERARLERDLLEVSEREQRRIGQDLHDGLCQQLTGTALASQVLAEKLAQRAMPEEKDIRRIVGHIEDAIIMARGMAKGLSPLETGPDSLMQGLDEFAATTSEMFGVACRFECDSPVLVHSPNVAGHLYRIAQEAVSNAIKHGQARTIQITLEASEQGTRLCIADDGIGMPATVTRNGMGLRIMADRARVIGAGFDIARNAGRGVLVLCSIPSYREAEEAHHG